MLYHYALLPDIFRPELLAKRPSAQLVLKQLLRGLCENGLVANLHEDAWMQHLRDKLLPDLPPQMKDSVLTCLKTLNDNNRLVTCAPNGNGNPRCHEDWLDAAVDVHSLNALQGIVLTQTLLDQYGLPHKAFMEMSEALDVPQWLERPRSLTVSMQYNDYKAALRPVLQYARTLELIDPYMNCYQDRFMDVVEMCAGLLGKGRYRCGSRRITVHAGDPQKDGETPADRLEAWQQRLLPFVSADAGLRFKVFLWSDYGKAERFHDRFIVTDQCCISVPAGLDTRRATTPWSLQDKSVWDEQVRKFRAVSTVYAPLGSIEAAK